MQIIQHTKPYIDDDEINAVINLLKTRLVNDGTAGTEVVNKIADKTGCQGGVAVSTGTLGIHLALKALGVKKENDEVIIPDYACRCLYDAVVTAGGKPVCCDINLNDYSLDNKYAESLITKNTRAIILPHMWGCPADIDEFLKLDVPVIEDCAHTLGVLYKGQQVGSFGDYSVFSFEGSKFIVGGEGGCVLSRYKENIKLIQELKASFHYRLSDIISSIVLVQLDKLNKIIEKRRYLAGIYNKGLEDFEKAGKVKLPETFEERESVFYRFVVKLDCESENIIEKANLNNIYIRNPLSSGPFTGKQNSNELFKKAISLPIYPDLQAAEAERVVEFLHKYL